MDFSEFEAHTCLKWNTHKNSTFYGWMKRCLSPHRFRCRWNLISVRNFLSKRCVCSNEQIIALAGLEWKIRKSYIFWYKSWVEIGQCYRLASNFWAFWHIQSKIFFTKNFIFLTRGIHKLRWQDFEDIRPLPPFVDKFTR